VVQCDAVCSPPSTLLSGAFNGEKGLRVRVYDVLQYVAVWCNVLQCGAVWCSVFPSVDARVWAHSTEDKDWECMITNTHA